MKSFFSPNIDRNGRLVRGLMALALLVGGFFAYPHSKILAALLLASGLFVGVEALRGWCAFRACGIKTKL
ncbi:MAG: DUF2892 domain-containing protein [Verrucomicrobiota bacterium]|nr:DUF2892 domain-containing protein [Verrucomicrobiota bacterium]